MFPPISSNGSIHRFFALLLNNRDALELFISALNEWRELERFDMAAVAEASLRDASLRESGIRNLGRVEAIGDLLAYINHIKRSEQ